MSRPRGIGALLAIVLYVALAAHVARAARCAQESDAGVGRRAWILGPSPALLESAADRRVDLALAHLSDDAPGATGWYDAYRFELAAARDLLARSLRARPGDARTLALLAAVTWELSGPAAGGRGEEATRMIALAAEAAPNSAPAQVLLGELLLRMARGDDAARRMRRALDLDPTLAVRAVRAYREHAYEPERILAILGPAPSVLLALQRAFLSRADPAPYLQALEDSLPGAGGALIAAYAETCVKLGLADRLLATVDALAPRASAGDEAERLCARSRAHLARREYAQAVADARGARDLVPDEPRISEQWGSARLAAGDPAGAVAAFRESLASLARRGGSPALRARMYRMIGVAEERGGQPARAYDAYLKTLELDPADVHALRRVTEMRRSAGLAGS